MKRFSLLELLHPDGSASTSFVLGSNCPENLFPETQMGSDQKVALFVVAPSVKECQSEGWLEEAAKSVNYRLADDGVCYLLVPVPWRLSMIRLLTSADLVIDLSIWHFPDWASSQYLVPLQRGPAHFAVERIVSAPLWKRTLAKEIFRYSSGRRFLSTFWKSVGISVRRRGARPLFQWLFIREQGEFFRGTALIRKSWRGTQGANILYCFSENDFLPSAIAKITSVEGGPTCLDSEAEVLESLSPGVRSAGVQIPQILRREQNDQRSSLFLSPLRGRSAADLLDLNPDLLSSILTKIVGWLERWHIATVNVRPPDVGKLEQDVFTPMEQLTPFLQDAGGYHDWLAHLVRAAVETSLPFVATHNDLTMANILVDEHDTIGVVDWETGIAENWPLIDFYYAVTDAVKIAHGYTSWLEAFKACYQPNGHYTRGVAYWEEQLRSAIGLSHGLTELCFHICWLHHASNEHRVSRPSDPRPFLQIVQWLAVNYSKSYENWS